MVALGGVWPTGGAGTAIDAFGSATGMRNRKLILWAPLIVFLLFLALVGIGLYAPSNRVIQSQLIGQPVPAFQLPAALVGRPGLSSDLFGRGEPRVVIFCSWCFPVVPNPRSWRRLPAAACRSTA